MTTGAKITTAEELLRMPDDGWRYELVKGELRKMAPAGSEHGYLAMRIGASLFQYVETHQLGRVYAAETGFRLESDPDTVRAPDAAFVSRNRLEEIAEVQGYFPGAPDLAVEVISPNDKYVEVIDKVFTWLDAGTRMVIIVNPPNETVTVYYPPNNAINLQRHHILDGGDVVPGWKLPISDLFQ